MIETLDQSSGKVFGMRVSGKLAHQDYERFVPLLEKLIEDHGSVRCLVELTDLQGIEPRALWDEIQFDVHHARQIERCAVVGDKKWEAWMTKLSRPIFARAEMRFFDRAETEKAWQWIKEGL
ncbi:MAG: STAS/SEC14 domain-containing protein [Isosphaeraceae bacterium]